MNLSTKIVSSGALTTSIVLTLVVLGSIASSVAYEVKLSDNFDWKYEMDALPSDLDLDGVGGLDFASYGSPSIDTTTGVLTVPPSCFFDSAGSTGAGIWQSTMDYTLGYTIEARVQVTDVSQGDTALEIFAGAPGGSSASTLHIADTSQGWFNGSDLGVADNSDNFHVFRVAQEPGSDSYTVWRDELKIATGLGSGYAAGNSLWFGDGSGGWSGTTKVDYLRFTQGAYAPSEPAIVPLEQKSSADFTWKYEMEVSPITQDLDGNGSPDFGLAPNSGITVDGTVLAYNTTSDLALMDYVESPASGLWAGKFNPTDGYTIEISLKVNEVATNSGFALFGSLGGTTTTSFLSVGAEGQGWGGFGDNLILGEADNTDGFHVFRLVKVPDADEYRVWRDGVLLDGSLPAGYSYGGEAFWYGDGNSSYGGNVEIDYIRFMDGAYAPVPEPAGFLLLLLGGLMLALRCRK